MTLGGAALVFTRSRVTILPTSPTLRIIEKERPLETVFILVEPARAENVGAAARALKTMGFAQLWLVNACPLQPEAYWVAHESAEILDQAQHFPDLASALETIDFSIATGARRRLEKNDYLSPQECVQALSGKSQSVARAALVFGRESSGLTGEEMALCDAATTIPLAVTQPSLNLAQAVMLYAWELSAARATPNKHFNATHISSNSEVNRTTYGAASDQLDHLLTTLHVQRNDNAYQWALELLARSDDRDLGLLMMLLRRIGERL